MSHVARALRDGGRIGAAGDLSLTCCESIRAAPLPPYYDRPGGENSHSTVETGRKLRFNALGERRGRGGGRGVEDIRALSEATQDCLFLDHRETRIQYQDEGR